MSGRRDPRPKNTIGWTREEKVDVRVYADSRGRNGFDEEMTVRIVDVVSIPPHMAFAHKRRSKSDSPLTTSVIGDPIVGIYVPADDRRRLRKNNVLSWDKLSQM